MSKQTIGSKVKRIRKANGLSQEELAKSLGYSGKSVIAHIEKGDADMTYEKILLMIKEYCLDANELFDISDIDRAIETYNEQPKSNKVVVYIHGMKGSSLEAEEYKYIEGYDIRGLDYEDGNPYEMKDIIRNKFSELIKPYDEVVVIANSIGAFYTYEYLYDFNIKQAFFISPIANMFQIIFNLMINNGITRERLREERFIKIDRDTTLSYEFYQYLSDNLHNSNYKVPTEILYGSKDELVYIEDINNFVMDHDARLTIKKGSKHYFHTDEEKEFIKNWILRNIK